MIKNLKSTKSFHPFGESHIKQVLKEMCHKTVYLFSKPIFGSGSIKMKSQTRIHSEWHGIGWGDFLNFCFGHKTALNPLSATCRCINHLAILIWKFAKNPFINILLSYLDNIMTEGSPPSHKKSADSGSLAPAACWRNPGCCKNGLGQWSASFLHTKKYFYSFEQ